jgi:SHS2 domain-containing protein
VKGIGFEFTDDVTSDLAFVARGRTLEDLFRAAAEALLAATVEDPERVARDELVCLELAEPALDLLLVRFLNELVYLRDAEGLLLHAGDVSISRGDEARLRASLAGEPIARGRHRLAGEVKAATAHQLRVAPTDEGWEAAVTLDV